MNATAFCFWLKGAIEMNDSGEFGIKQTQAIENNLNEVFNIDANPHPVCHFLQGHFKVNKPHTLDQNSVKIIYEELNKTFETDFFKKIKEQQKPIKKNQIQPTHRYPEVRATC